MTTYNGKCHCGQTEWTAKVEDHHIIWLVAVIVLLANLAALWGSDGNVMLTVSSHCDTCKTLSGGAYTLNTIVPQEDLKITKGDVKAYTYYGDSGT